MENSTVKTEVSVTDSVAVLVLGYAHIGTPVWIKIARNSTGIRKIIIIRGYGRGSARSANTNVSTLRFGENRTSYVVMNVSLCREYDLLPSGN